MYHDLVAQVAHDAFAIEGTHDAHDVGPLIDHVGALVGAVGQHVDALFGRQGGLLRQRRCVEARHRGLVEHLGREALHQVGHGVSESDARDLERLGAAGRDAAALGAAATVAVDDDDDDVDDDDDDDDDDGDGACDGVGGRDVGVPDLLRRRTAPLPTATGVS